MQAPVFVTTGLTTSGQVEGLLHWKAVRTSSESNFVISQARLLLAACTSHFVRSTLAFTLFWRVEIAFEDTKYPSKRSEWGTVSLSNKGYEWPFISPTKEDLFSRMAYGHPREWIWSFHSSLRSSFQSRFIHSVLLATRVILRTKDFLFTDDWNNRWVINERSELIIPKVMEWGALDYTTVLLTLFLLMESSIPLVKIRT